MRRARHTVPALVAGASLLVAACSSGESAITAGNDATEDEPAATTEPVEETRSGEGTADDVTEDETSESETSAADTSEGTADDSEDQPDETTAVTTTTSPLADLAACPTDALDSADGVVDITFWHGLNLESEEALQAVTDRYNESQDRVQVDLQNQGGYLATIDEYYQSSVSSRPEVIMFPEYGLQQAIDSDSFIPAGACIESSGFDISPLQPTILQAYATEGVQWGMPFNVSNPVLYYNRLIFEDAGLDPDVPPTSLEEVRAFSQQIVDSGAAPYGIALDSGIDSGGGWYLEQWLANAGELYANNDNGRSARPTEVYFDGPTGVELLTFVQNLVEDGLAFYVGDNAGGAEQFLKMADVEEPAAMAIGSSASLGSVMNALAGGLVPGFTTDDLGVGPLPGPSGTPTAIVGGAAMYVVAGQGDAEAAAAWDYIQYLVSPEIQSEWTVLTGYLPLRDDALELEPAASKFEADPRFRVAYDQLVSSPDIAAGGPLLGPHRQIRSETANAVAAIMTGADVQSTLSSAADLAEAYLADYAATN